MILKLSLRYFLLNQKRTIKGSQIVAIGFIAIFSTNVLISGFTNEVTIITSKLNKTDVTYKISSISDGQFHDDQISELEKLSINERGVTYLNFEMVQTGFFSSSEYIDIEIPFHFTNLTKVLLRAGFNTGIV
ncbi:MAG: hypothetical protein ACXAC2_22470, partial [Candidatus Kariarchaeaceae archaeon]